MNEDEIIGKMTWLLERGATMLAAHHDCGNTLFRYKGELVCPRCSFLHEESKDLQNVSLGADQKAFQDKSNEIKSQLSDESSHPLNEDDINGMLKFADDMNSDKKVTTARLSSSSTSDIEGRELEDEAAAKTSQLRDREGSVMYDTHDGSSREEDGIVNSSVDTGFDEDDSISRGETACQSDLDRSVMTKSENINTNQRQISDELPQINREFVESSIKTTLLMLISNLGEQIKGEKDISKLNSILRCLEETLKSLYILDKLHKL